MTILPVAMIGCGYFGEKHLAVLASLPHVQIRTICDADPARAAAMAAKYDVPDWTNDVNEIMMDPNLIAVIIATHEDTHAELSIAAMEHGKHVLVEKPMATSYGDVARMVAKAKETNRTLMPGHILRFDPRYSLSKEKWEQLGKCHSIYAKRNSPRNIRDFYKGIHPVMMTMIHDIDLLLWYVKAPVHKVYAVQTSTQGTEQIDNVWAIIQFQDGTTACLQSSWLLPEREGVVPESTMEILAEHGKVVISNPSDEVMIHGSWGLETTDVSMWPLLHGQQSGAIRNEVEHFLQCVRKGVPSDICPPEIALSSSRLAEWILQSAATKQELVL